MTRRRLSPLERRLQIINGFIAVAVRQGYQTVTREQVAKHLNISDALVTRYFDDSITGLRLQAVQKAIDDKNLIILAQALAVNEPIANIAPRALKEQAAALLIQ